MSGIRGGSNGRRLVAIVVGALLVGSVVAIGSTGALPEHETDEDDDELAQFRIVHASPDAPAVDVYIDGTPVLENVSFGDVTDYREIYPGVYDVSIRPADDPDTVVFESKLPVKPGSYTIAAEGELSEEGAQAFVPVILLDEATQPSEGDGLVRLAHLSPDAPTVDVTVAETGDVLFDNVSYSNATDYQSVPAGNYTLEVRAATADGDGDVVTTANVTITEGTASTALAVGYLDPAAAAGDEPFEVLVLDDNLEADSAMTDSEAGTETQPETEVGDGDG